MVNDRAEAVEEKQVVKEKAPWEELEREKSEHNQAVMIPPEAPIEGR
jgi:hypothetical protein